jgi:adenylate kinase family enzyme
MVKGCSAERRGETGGPGVRALLLIAPTGAGKTPLGNLLEARGLRGAACHHFDFGEHLRRIAAGAAAPAGLDAGDGACVRRLLETGALLEDRDFRIAEAILRDFIAARHVRPSDLLILTGLPHHVSQADDVDAIVRVEEVLHLSCPAEVVAERIRADTGGDRAGRDDDGPAATGRKLATFHERTAPLIEHYRRKGARIETVEVGTTTTADDLWTILNYAAP